MATDTNTAPQWPETNRHGDHRGAWRNGDLRRRQNVLDGRVGRHIKDAHHPHPGDQGNRKAPLRAFYFSGHHGEVIPAVVCPERRDQRNHEPGNAAFRAGKAGMQVRHAAVGTGEAEAADHHDQYHLEPGEEELEVTGLLDAQVIEPGDQPGDGDGEELCPGDEQRSPQHHSIEPRQRLRTRPSCGPGRW